MITTIEIKDERLYGRIIDFCDANDISFDEYVEEKLRDGFNTDIYGDLNVKLYGKDSTVHEEIRKAAETPLIESMKLDGSELLLNLSGYDEPIRVDIHDFLEMGHEEDSVVNECCHNASATEKNDVEIKSAEEVKPKRKKRTIKSN